jgi:hypothetical protein
MRFGRVARALGTSRAADTESDEGLPGANIKNTGDESCLDGQRSHQFRSFPRKRGIQL